MSKRSEEAATRIHETALKEGEKYSREHGRSITEEVSYGRGFKSGYIRGYEQSEKDTIQIIRDELNRRLDMYDGLSPETIHPVRLDEERSMIKFLDELEKNRTRR